MNDNAASPCGQVEDGGDYFGSSSGPGYIKIAALAGVEVERDEDGSLILTFPTIQSLATLANEVEGLGRDWVEIIRQEQEGR